MDSIATRTRSRKKKSLEMDRISALPDSILCKILSLLPTKYAVATSVLSTRWKRLFPFFWIPPIRLQFDDSMLFDYSGYTSDDSYSGYIHENTAFTNFVSKLLKKPFLDATGVDTVDLKCNKEYDYFEIMSWIDAALRLNVRHLALSFRLYDAKMLFLQLDGCTSLVSLDVGISYDVKLYGEFSLPNLRRLHLSSLTFYGEAPSLSEMIAGCPMLKDLALVGCNFQYIDIVVRSPVLKYFNISGCTSDSRYRLELDAPNLEELMLMGCFAARNYRLSTFNSLSAAYVSIGMNPITSPDDIFSEKELEYNNHFDDDRYCWYFDSGIEKILTACSNVDGLSLDVCAMDSILHSSLPVPTFENLTWLSLNYLEHDEWAALARLLHCTPKLEELTFEEALRDNAGSFADFECLVPSPPICLELHLKEIEFCKFEGKDEEIKLLEYFLKNGKVLERAVLQALPSLDSRIINRLNALVNHSKIVLNRNRKFPWEEEEEEEEE